MRGHATDPSHSIEVIRRDNTQRWDRNENGEVAVGPSLFAGKWAPALPARALGREKLGHSRRALPRCEPHSGALSPGAPAGDCPHQLDSAQNNVGKIVVSENVSLDGVVEDPAGDEDFGRGGWVGLLAAREEVAKAALDEALGAEAFLLGRRTYEWLAARWPSRSGELADRLNSLPKYVVSSTLEDPNWTNSTVLKGDPVDEVSKLKESLDGEIVVAGSFQLLRTLMEYDLIDELRLKIFPVVLGAGGRLFGDTSDTKPLRLVNTQTLGEGIAFLTYELVRAS